MINACIDYYSNHAQYDKKYSYHTKCVEKHVHKKIDRSETDEKEKLYWIMLFRQHGYQWSKLYSSLLDATVD